MFVSATGSKGTALGFGRYFKMQNPKLELVCDDAVPRAQTIDGTRDLERQRGALHELGPVYPDRGTDRRDTARAYSAKLNEGGIPGGPSSGAALASCSIYYSFASAASGLTNCAVLTAR